MDAEDPCCRALLCLARPPFPPAHPAAASVFATAPPRPCSIICAAEGSRGDRRDASPGGSLRVRVGLPANPGRHSVPVHAHVPGHAQAPLAGPRFGDEEPRVEILVRRCRRWVFFVLCVPPPPLEAIRSELKGEGAR